MARNPYLHALLVFLLGLTLTLVVNHHGRQRAEEMVQRQGERQLDAAARRLHQELTHVVQLNQELAARVSAQSGPDESTWQTMAAETLSRHRHLKNVAVSRGTVVSHVFPLKGNEAVYGMDYRQYPDQMSGVQKAIDTRQSQLVGPVVLIQGGGLGLIARTPMFNPPTDQGPGELRGLVAAVVGLENLLVDVGLNEEQLPFRTAIAAESEDGKLMPSFMGDPKLFANVSRTVTIVLPSGRWHIATQVKPEVLEQAWNSTVIQATGIGVSALLSLLVAFIGRNLPETLLNGRRGLLQRKVSLRTLIIAALMVMVAPALMAQAWLAYRAAVHTSERFQEDLSSEIGARVHDKVVQFFDIPRRVLSFTTDQFRTGAMDLQDADHVTRNFVLQIRQEPLLTFLAAGTASGEFLSASRPPMGTDQGLRLIEARVSSGRAVHVYRAASDGLRGELMSRGRPYFDARTRPWFKSALETNRVTWYPVNTYAIDDEAGGYQAVGIGMSAPLKNKQQQFIGVVIADVALSQLNMQLASIMKDLGGVAFLAEGDGKLLATSTQDPVYHQDQSVLRRISLQDSENPLIRTVGHAILEKKTARGRTFRNVNGERFLLDWRTYQLPDGPELTIGVVMPQSRLAAPSEGLKANAIWVAALLMFCGLVAAWVLSDHLARPLVRLSQWATRWGSGVWSAPRDTQSGIVEVDALARALGHMATQIHDHTEELRLQVAERTADLEAANRVLSELSHTDGLTGVANRRRFDELLEQEWSRAMRSGQDLALVMLDVDHFKLFNDRYGHLAGDDCLRAIAGVLMAQCRRAGDQPARYGGEEFVILVAEDDVPGVRHLAEHVRHAVRELCIPHQDSEHAVVTVSLGVAVIKPALGVSARSLIALADEALYRAKSSGRNRVEVAGGG